MTSIVKPLIVTDSDFSETVVNYGQIIEGITKNDEFLKRFVELSTEINDEFYDELLKSTALLKDLPDKQLEHTLNLVMYFISDPLFSSDSSEVDQQRFTSNFQLLLDSVYEISPVKNPAFNDKVSLKFTTVLSVLTIFFNLLENHSSLRFTVLQSILKVYNKIEDQESLSENVNFLKPILKRTSSGTFVFENYLIDSKTSGEDIVSFTGDLSKLIENNFPNESLIILKSILLKHKQHQTPALVEALLVKSFVNPREIDLSYFTNFKAGDSAIFEALKLYTTPQNNLKEFSSFVGSAEIPVSSEILISKKEYLIVANLALKASESSNYNTEIESESKQGNLVKKTLSTVAPVITYKQISDELGHNSDLLKIETVLINAVKLGIFEGKLDQLKQIFSIYKLNLIILLDGSENNKLRKKEWEFILNNLKNWKNGLSQVASVVDQQKKKLHQVEDRK